MTSSTSFKFAGTALLAMLCLVGCATPGNDLPAATDLSCTLITNCVSSSPGSSFEPLRYAGPPEQALADLRATLAQLPEARVARAEGLQVEAIFTTALGFRDQVDFRIDPQAQRIHFRSRSLFGLFDFGKNRSRMREFAARFAASQSAGAPAEGQP